MPTTFVNERLLESVEQGAEGGPNFLTTIIELGGGEEVRNIEWSRARQEWDLSYGIDSPEMLQDVVDLFYVCFGRARGFLFKDYSDYQIGLPSDPSTRQSIGAGDVGANTIFQIYKLYSIGSESHQRPITKPVQGTLLVYEGGVLKTETTHYTVDYTTGLITFLTAPGDGVEVDVICEFDVPVRFDTDALKKKVTWVGAQELPSIPIKELKGE